MPFKKLSIDCYDATVGDEIAVRIKRNSDKFVLDSDGKFKATASSPFYALKAGTGDEASIASVEVDIDPAQFLDGDYKVYYHDMTSATKRVFFESEVTVFGGSADTIRTPTTTEIALRMFSVNCGSHRLPGSYGLYFNTVHDKVNAIYDWVSKQPGFVAPKAKKPNS